MIGRTMKAGLEKASWIAGALSAVVAVLTAASAFQFGKDLKNIVPAPKSELVAEVKSLHQELADLKQRMQAIQVTPSASAPTSGLAREVQRNSLAVAELGARLQKLEQAILASPSKALEIPLLQRDIESLKLAQASSTATLKDSVDRVYDQNKWLLGGVSVSILALGLSALLRAKAEKE